MLSASTTETVERVALHVIAALHRNLLDGVGHVLNRDADEAFGHVFRSLAAANLGCQRGELLTHGFCVQRFVAIGAEHFREVIRVQLAEHHVGVGNGERPATAIAGRAGVGAGRVRSDAEARPIIVQDRSATCRHRVNAHHGRTHAHARHFGFEGAFELAVIVGNVRRGAAHVETDQLAEAGHAARLDHADHAAGGAGQDGVLALEQFCCRQPAGRLHEHQPAVGAFGAKLACDLVHVPAQDGRQVGIHHRGVAAAHQLHQWRDLVADRNLGEADLAGNLAGAGLVIGVAVAMHEHDGHGANAGVKGCL
jgi:hypothetical protein